VVHGDPAASPDPWPANPPSITTPTVTVTLHANPDSALPVVLPPPVSGSSCSCPAIDFTPIESVSVGSKFPFGAVTWFTTELGTIPTTGTALAFDITYPAGGSLHVDTANTTWETDFRPWVFPLLETFMTLGMFYAFATKILGLNFGSGGDE